MTSHVPRIHAVTVNHNTSHFVELMLRTCFLTNYLESLSLTVTVLDNGSNDAHLPELKSYLESRHIDLVQTGFDATVAGEKHGAALQEFVLTHEDCDYYLFLDSDMWFIETDTIGTMLQELERADSNEFANQARIAGYYAGRIIEGADGIPGAGDSPTWVTHYNQQDYVTSLMPRCSPVCSLFRNTPLFRRVVRTIGFMPVIRFYLRTAQYYDTFGLMTHIMRTHEQEFIVSAKTVNHFTQASYMPEHRAPKDRDCLLLLEDLRAGRGMTRENFYESDWVKHLRQSS